jgi:BMFP domain-containing protein YqiC
MGRPKKTDEPKTERVTLKKLEAKIAELEAKLA